MPMPSISACARACAPLPSATIAMMAATPMMMPSMVSSVRTLLRHSERHAAGPAARRGQLEDFLPLRLRGIGGAYDDPLAFFQAVEDLRIAAVRESRHHVNRDRLVVLEHPHLLMIRLVWKRVLRFLGRRGR